VRLNLGCGSVPEPGYVNVDVWDQPGVDVAHDLDVFPWPFKDGEAEEIRAWDVFEHVADPVGFMGECHRVLAPGGLLFIHTVHYQSRNAYTDPTHRRFLTEESFDYWVPGTGLHQRYGAAYARGCCFAREGLWLDGSGGDMNVKLRRI
jgi:SAM-dependent methyltransferase